MTIKPNDEPLTEDDVYEYAFYARVARVQRHGGKGTLDSAGYMQALPAFLRGNWPLRQAFIRGWKDGGQ